MAQRPQEAPLVYGEGGEGDRLLGGLLGGGHHRQETDPGSMEPLPLGRPTSSKAMTYPRRLLACVLTPLAAKDAENSRWVHDGNTMEPPPDALRAFRRSFYECFHRRKDALFELSDAMLSADGAVPSPAHLSLQQPHRRGWGSLYAALDRGRIDAEALRKLLACHPLAGAAI